MNHDISKSHVSFSGISLRRITGRLLTGFFLGLAFAGAVYPSPPDYLSFNRSQKTDHTPQPEDILRIWAIYIGQGDALLIQLPTKLSGGASGATERIDILVDGGPSGPRIREFLRRLYPNPTTIEHVVLTHHDSDHVKGLTGLIDDDHFKVGAVYHNGLASWKLGGRGFNPSGQGWPPRSSAVYDQGKTKGMALLESDGVTLAEGSLLDDLKDFRDAVREEDLVGEYARFAQAIVDKPVPNVSRVHRDGSFVTLPIAGFGSSPGPPVSITPLWPERKLRSYGGWSYTINGNSVTFQLSYGEFSMLFTGDHNELSQESYLERISHSVNDGNLDADVLKVPHHGSRHGDRHFFRRVDPVVSVASMGKRGFGDAWKHPSTDVIRWLHGAHRVYHTYVHERRFRYSEIRTEAKRREMVERTHILIETDGEWFRLVETPDPDQVPSVRETRRGHGTRWIFAKE